MPELGIPLRVARVLRERQPALSPISANDISGAT